MEEKEPSLREWKALYEAMAEFKKTHPWDWMSDLDVFGVKDPVTDRIGYCCILGMGGEFFGLVVYLGTEGLETYLRVRSGEIHMYSADALYVQRCLTASFDNRDCLDERDLSTIKKLGLRYRGSNAWPFFKSYRPAYYPWYLTRDEANYLRLCLDQAVDVSLRLRDDPRLLQRIKENHFLVRVSQEHHGKLSWRDQLLMPQPFEEEIIVPTYVDEATVEKIKTAVPQLSGVWEMELLHFPEPVQDKGKRPFFPYALVCLDHSSGYMHTSRICTPDRYMSQLLEELLKLAETRHILPEKILVREETTLRLLQPLASALGVKVMVAVELPALEEAEDSLHDFFGGSGLAPTKKPDLN